MPPRKKDEKEKKEEVKIEIPKIDISDEEKEAFFKSMLTDTPYESVKDLLGGKLTVGFRALSVADNMAVFDRLKRDQFNDIINNDSNYLTSLTCYKLAKTLTTINGDKVFDTDDLEAQVAVIKKWPVFKVSAVTEAFKQFEETLVHLTNAVSDPTFWVAAK